MTTTEPLTCVRCDTPLEPGFLIDAAHAAFRQARWSAGVPKPSIWTGEINRRQVQTAYKVDAFRCPSCGYLELYANPPVKD